jgi:hypothetical protein
MMEDAEIAARFSQSQLKADRISITNDANAATLTTSLAQTLPGVTALPQSDAQKVVWSEIVEQKREIWPIQYLMPGGAEIQQ